MRRSRSVSVLLALALVFGACGDDDTAAPATDTTAATTTTAAPTTAESTTTTEPAPAPLTILVTNDDGIGAPGIDALVNSLTELEAVELIVVAPNENKSGSSDTTTPEGVTSAPGVTASGFAGTSVVGFPADAVNLALDELGLEPDLVVSGVNEGQNVGPFAAVSGTVGAARTAIRRGIPAVATSAGLGENADFQAAADLAVAWIEANRAAIGDGSIRNDIVVSFNVPGCTAGDIGALVQVPLATEFPEGVNPFESDCSIPPTGDPVDDVDAIGQGYATQTEVPADL